MNSLSVVGLLESMPPMLIIWFIQIVAEANRKKARASVDRTVKVGQLAAGRQAENSLGHSLCHSLWASGPDGKGGQVHQSDCVGGQAGNHPKVISHAIWEAVQSARCHALPSAMVPLPYVASRRTLLEPPPPLRSIHSGWMPA